MKKQITIMAILFIAILLLIPCVSNADNSYKDELDTDKVQTGGDSETDTIVNDLYYRIIDSENKKVEVTGVQNSEFKTKVEVPSSVEIEGQTYTVTSIGNNAISFCDTIQTITLPNTITTIKLQAFQYNRSLTSINLPDSITDIERMALYNCSALTNITIPKNIKNLGNEAFCSCSKVTNITIPSSLTSIPNNCFMDTGIETIIIPDTVTSIGSGAFSSCNNLKTITIPNGITQINANTFSGCRNLENIIIPKSVQAIALNAFTTNINNQNVPLEKVVINTYSGAYAETFAKENNLKYKLLDGTEEPETPDNTKVGYVTIGGNGYTLTGAEVVNTSDIYAEMKAKLNEKGYKTVYCAYELTATGADIQNGVELTFDVGTSNNGKQVMILHKKADGTFEDFTRTVANGKVTITVTEFSPFMLAIKENSTSGGSSGSTGGSSSSGSSSSGSSNTGTSNNGGNTNNSNNGNNDNSNDNKQDIKNDKDTNNSNKKNDNLDDTPKTGDRINTAFIVLVISSVCAIVSFIIILKNRNAEA